ncbi:MAG: sigma-70 family RNA polymerase sigma factor [Planctomycetota bacterium]|jgi:RNA polymerase sigma-70 factor (ECF subfamily)|nr:sigma-70 family RNA polymerase sigma factor [Planctomycetota bacterium]
MPKAGTDSPSDPSKGQTGSEPADDRALVDAVRAGDASAYAELVDRYGERLYHTLLHMAAGDGELAAEFVQEAFVRAFERLDRFAGESSFYTWLYRLARNRAIDLLAKKRPKSMDRPGLEAQGDANKQGSGPHHSIERTELQLHVQAALHRLPTEQREIIILRDFDDLDYATIADQLDLAVGTVKSRLNRARAALREQLEDLVAGGAL